MSIKAHVTETHPMYLVDSTATIRSEDTGIRKRAGRIVSYGHRQTVTQFARTRSIPITAREAQHPNALFVGGFRLQFQYFGLRVQFLGVFSLCHSQKCFMESLGHAYWTALSSGLLPFIPAPIQLSYGLGRKQFRACLCYSYEGPSL